MRIRKDIYSIIINTDQKKLLLYKNNEYFKTYMVAIGKNSSPTPKGDFKVITKVKNPGGPYGTRWIGISSPHIGIHGTNDESSIGTNVSKGCIRLSNKDVNELYDLIAIDTLVKII